MNPRERKLLFLLVGLLGVGAVGVLGYQWFLKPYRTNAAALAKLTHEAEDAQDQLDQLYQEKRLLQDARKKGLPPNVDRAAAEYAKFLRPLLLECGLSVDDFQGPTVAEVKVGGSPGTPGKKSSHKTLTFNIRAKGEAGQLGKALAAIQHAPLLHRVKTLTVDRMDTSVGKDASKRLTISMVVEALIVGGTPKDGLTLPSALDRTKLTSLSGLRQYADLKHRNLFVGKSPPEPPQMAEKEEDPGPPVPEHVRLVSTNVLAREAHLRNLLASVRTPEIRVRSIPRSGYDTFRIMDEDYSRVLVKAKVLRVDHRDVYFQVSDWIYAIHVGQTVADAMRSPLSDERVVDLGLEKLFDPNWGKEEQKKKAPAPKKSKGGRGGKGGKR